MLRCCETKSKDFIYYLQNFTIQLLNRIYLTRSKKLSSDKRLICFFPVRSSTVARISVISTCFSKHHTIIFHNNSFGPFSINNIKVVYVHKVNYILNGINAVIFSKGSENPGS